MTEQIKCLLVQDNYSQSLLFNQIMQILEVTEIQDVVPKVLRLQQQLQLKNSEIDQFTNIVNDLNHQSEISENIFESKQKCGKQTKPIKATKKRFAKAVAQLESLVSALQAEENKQIDLNKQRNVLTNLVWSKFESQYERSQVRNEPSSSNLQFKDLLIKNLESERKSEKEKFVVEVLMLEAKINGLEYELAQLISGLKSQEIQ